MLEDELVIRFFGNLGLQPEIIIDRFIRAYLQVTEFVEKQVNLYSGSFVMIWVGMRKEAFEDIYK